MTGSGERPEIARSRALECLVLFVAAPSVLAMVMRPGLLFPAIWLLSVVCLAVLWRDPSFDRRRLWNGRGAIGHLPLIIGLGVVGAALLTGILMIYAPDRLFDLPRRNPRVWLLILVLYPILSVYPQETAFRAYFFHRYAPLFGRRATMVAASAMAFGWAHVVMRNGWAMGFSAIGGVLFGLTYERTKSLAASCLEHAWYGCFLFTIGWGAWFYTGGHR